MFTVRNFPAAELGNSSFLVADAEAGAAVVIDAYRDVDGYLTYAEQHHLRVGRALDTHVHNDFASGARELKAVHTPGHTPDHKSYLVLEGETPKALFSGGAIMVGSIARTDLFGPHLAMHLAIEALR